MNDKLTKEEEILLSKIKTSGKWDHLIYDLTVMIPCFIIMALGIYFQSAAAIIIGMSVYAVLIIQKSIHSDRVGPAFKSLIEKLESDK